MTLAKDCNASDAEICNISADEHVTQKLISRVLGASLIM